MIQHAQLAQSDLLNVGRQPARPLAIEDFLCLWILEVANYMRSLYRLALNAKRNHSPLVTNYTNSDELKRETRVHSSKFGQFVT